MYIYIYLIASPANSITEVSKKDMELTVEPNSAEALSTVQVALRGDGRHAEIGVAKDWESDEIYGGILGISEELWGIMGIYGEFWGFMGIYGDFWGFRMIESRYKKNKRGFRCDFDFFKKSKHCKE